MSTTEIILTLVSLGVGGGWIWEHYKRKHPTELERAHTRQADANFVKAHTEAQLAHIELSHELQRMVDEKTAHIEEILVKREMEHAHVVENLLKKLAEETARAEDYWEQLKDAKRETAHWKGQYEALCKNKK